MDNERPTSEQLAQRIADLDRRYAIAKTALRREINEHLAYIEQQYQHEREKLLATPVIDDDDDDDASHAARTREGHDG